MDAKVEIEWSSLLAMADRLGFGLLRREDREPVNGPMAELVLEFGADSFSVSRESALRLRDRRGHWHRFLVWVFETVWMVQRLSPSPGGKVLPSLPVARFYPMLRLDGQGRVLEANAAGGELLQYFLPEADDRIREALFSARESGERSVDLQLGGRLFAFAVNPLAGGYFLFGREITERRQAEASLRRNEARLRSLLEAAPDAIVTVAPDGRIGFVNPQCERMFHYAPGSLRQEAIERLIPAWFRIPMILSILAEGAGTDELGGSVKALRADGSRFPVELSASALDLDGELYVTAIIRDVTEREAAAREIHELNTHLQNHVAQLTSLNAELEAFSYTVSHDLRGPLRSIDGFSGVLLEEYGSNLDETARHYVERVRAATARMSDLIDGLLKLSRITRAELKREPIDLSSIVHFVTEGLRRAEPERKARFLVQEQVWGDGDKTLLTVVLENLLSNAWKFTARREEAQIEFGMNRKAGQDIYYVRDNGAGFDMSYAHKLFFPFERLHETHEYPGTGIGLATVERAIRRHGGRVWAEGEVDRGSTFYFTLRQPE